MRLLGGIIAAAVIGALVLIVALTVAPEHAEVAADVYLIFFGGLVLLGLAVFTGRSGGSVEDSAFEEARRPRPRRPPATLPALERLTRELSLGTQSAFDYHFRFRPVLTEITDARLAARGRRLEEAERLLPPEAWDLVRPDRPPPTDRHAAGADPDAVRRLVEALEKI